MPTVEVKVIVVVELVGFVPRTARTPAGRPLTLNVVGSAERDLAVSTKVALAPGTASRRGTSLEMVSAAAATVVGGAAVTAAAVVGGSGWGAGAVVGGRGTTFGATGRFTARLLLAASAEGAAIKPTTTVAAAALTITSDFPRRLAVSGGSATFVLTTKSRSAEPTTLSVSGLPAGVRAVLATNPTTSTTSMTLTTTVGITPGGYQPFLVTAIGGGASATLALELVVDTTAAVATTVAPGAQQSFSPTADVLLPGPIFPGSTSFVAYRVNLNRLPGVSGAAIVSAGTVPLGLALGVSQTSVTGSSFDVSFSASSTAVSGFYQPTMSVALNGYTVLIAFPVQVNAVF